jgi:hypothetical protein
LRRRWSRSLGRRCHNIFQLKTLDHPCLVISLHAESRLESSSNWKRLPS